MSEMIKCWCGMEVKEGRLHYPGDEPEDGPAHKPKAPCDGCLMEPHQGSCDPICTCSNPNPEWFAPLGLMCASCGHDVHFTDQPEHDPLPGEEGYGYD